MKKNLEFMALSSLQWLCSGYAVVSFFVFWIVGQKERKTVRQLRKRDNGCKVGEQLKRTKITTNSFLARDLNLATVIMEMIVNIHMMCIWTLEHVTISALYRTKLKLITYRYRHKQLEWLMLEYQEGTMEAKLRSSEQSEIVLRSRCWWNQGLSSSCWYSFSFKWSLRHIVS